MPVLVSQESQATESSPFSLTGYLAGVYDWWFGTGNNKKEL
jgi:hypothetical protein